MPVEEQNKNILEGITPDLDNREFNHERDLVEKSNYPIIYHTGKAGTCKTRKVMFDPLLFSGDIILSR